MASSSTVLVTGANTGIGFETVLALLRSSQAYTILLGGRNLDKATAAALSAQNRVPDTNSIVSPVQVDIEDDDSISRAFDHVQARYNRVDVLINNAGNSEPISHTNDRPTFVQALCSILSLKSSNYREGSFGTDHGTSTQQGHIS
jgi:NAD(P)-dependent dehydrogenase (short-subunit alcohol dehydrogenase family)